MTVGPLRFTEPFRRFRLLMSDGRVVDVEATRDDSVMRAWILDQLGGTKTNELKIVGVAGLHDEEALL